MPTTPFQMGNKQSISTFRMLAIFAPPLPITLPAALAGMSISSVEGGGNLRRRAVYDWKTRDKRYKLQNQIL